MIDGEALGQLRRAARISRYELGRRMAVSQQRIDQLERQPAPEDATVGRFLVALGEAIAARGSRSHFIERRIERRAKRGGAPAPETGGEAYGLTDARMRTERNGADEPARARRLDTGDAP